MEFVRKKKRGQSQKVCRTWFSEEGYRIVWRKEVCGVHMPARFQACVRVLVPYSNDELRPMWDFVNRDRRLIKTLKAAEEECERHKRLWMKACEATGIRALKGLFGGKLPLGLPLWARKKMDCRLYAVLTDNRPAKHRNVDDEPCTASLSLASDAPGLAGPTRTSGCSASPTGPRKETDTHASRAEGKGKSTTRRTRRARSKDTATSVASIAACAGEAGGARKKPAAKRTRKPSKPTARKRTSTFDSSTSGTRRSRSSRTTKSQPSGS